MNTSKLFEELSTQMELDVNTKNTTVYQDKTGISFARLHGVIKRETFVLTAGMFSIHVLMNESDIECKSQAIVQWEDENLDIQIRKEFFESYYITIEGDVIYLRDAKIPQFPEKFTDIKDLSNALLNKLLHYCDKNA